MSYYGPEDGGGPNDFVFISKHRGQQYSDVVVLTPDQMAEAEAGERIVEVLRMGIGMDIKLGQVSYGRVAPFFNFTPRL